MVRAIITDFDGTLVDTFEANLLAYQQAFHEVGITLTKDAYKACFGYRFERFMIEMGVEDDRVANQIRELKKQCYPQFFEYLKLNIPLMELIRSFRYMGGKSAIASTSRKENLMNVLEFFNLTNEFDLILSGADVKNGKPNPEIYQIAMQRMEVLPDDTLVFEDSFVGIEAAKHSGVHYIKVII